MIWAALEFAARVSIVVVAVVYFLFSYVKLQKGWEDHDFEQFQESAVLLLLGALLVFHVLWLTFPGWFMQSAQ